MQIRLFLPALDPILHLTELLLSTLTHTKNQIYPSHFWVIFLVYYSKYDFFIKGNDNSACFYYKTNYFAGSGVGQKRFISTISILYYILYVGCSLDCRDVMSVCSNVWHCPFKQWRRKKQRRNLKRSSMKLLKKRETLAAEKPLWKLLFETQGWEFTLLLFTL